MPEFEMNGADVPEFNALDSFTQGYIEALFFTEEEPGTTREERVFKSGKVRPSWERRQSEGQIKDMPGDYGFEDLAPEALERIKKDCAAFQHKARALLAIAYEVGLKPKSGSSTPRDYDEMQAGRDFWFTHNGHGVGYWDREFADHESVSGETLGAALSTAAGRHESSVYIGDDSKIYIM